MNGEMSHVGLLVAILGRWETSDDDHRRMYKAVYTVVDRGMLSRAAELYLSRNIVGVVQLLVADKCSTRPIAVRDEIARMVHEKYYASSVGGGDAV